MPVANSKFSNFNDGGELIDGDTVVGLRNGINTRFIYPGGIAVNDDGQIIFTGAFDVIFNFSTATDLLFPTSGTVATTSQIITNVVVSTTTQQMQPNKSYTVNNPGGSGVCVLTLPTAADSTAGDVIEITGSSADGWSIAQNASQTIQIGSAGSTPGVGGSVSSTNRWDSVRLKCTVFSGLIWVALGGPSGNLTIV